MHMKRYTCKWGLSRNAHRVELCEEMLCYWPFAVAVVMVLAPQACQAFVQVSWQQVLAQARLAARGAMYTARWRANCLRRHCLLCLPSAPRKARAALIRERRVCVIFGWVASARLV